MLECDVCCRSVAPGSGFYSSLANSTAALQIWPEHRYYAEAEPYTPADDFAHFTIEQSLVDHIELVLYVQNVYNLTTNPVIAIGSSYSKCKITEPHSFCHCVAAAAVQMCFYCLALFATAYAPACIIIKWCAQRSLKPAAWQKRAGHTIQSCVLMCNAFHCHSDAPVAAVLNIEMT